MEIGFISTLHQIKKVVEKECRPLMKRYGLRKVELDILSFLAQHKAPRDTAQDIMSLYHISKAHISKGVSNLKKSGYIVQREDAKDQRVLHMSLSEKAGGVLQEYEALKRSVIERLLGGISEEEKKTLFLLLEKIAHNIVEVTK